MSLCFHNGRTSLARPLRRPSAAFARAVATKVKASEMLKATSTVAQQLEKTGIWTRRGGRKASSAPKAIEPHRVNIVSEKLCDDIIKYLGSSLERHRGCDLIDLNPGAGVWSSKLHDFLEPRNHIMMDLDAELYRPFLEDLTSKENVQLIPKSGIVWKDLVEMIQTHLSHQQALSDGAEPTRNDTLLVTANLSTFPKKSFLGFDSISTMVMYQFMSSIKSSSLFQKYGLVRMLLWVNDEEKRRLVPKSINRRKRGSFEAELACEWIHEVAGQELEAESRYALRDEWINKESGLNTLGRMQAQGLKVPKGREVKMYKDSLKSKRLIGQKLAGIKMPSIARPFKKELENLEHEFDEDSNPVELSNRLKVLRSREKFDTKHYKTFLELLQEHEKISAMSMEDPSAFEKANEAWNERIDNLKKNQRMEFSVLRDSYHLFRQDPPALLWDRRAYEPLTAKADEFFPNAPTALLDIQPKAMHPLLRQIGPKSNHAGDISDVMLRSWWNLTLQPANKAMDGLWPGFGELITEVPSLRDVRRGGTPMTGRGSLTARGINEEQWTELLETWMRWPFRPTYGQMLSRMSEDEADIDDEDTKSNAVGIGF